MSDSRDTGELGAVAAAAPAAATAAAAAAAASSGGVARGTLCSGTAQRVAPASPLRAPPRARELVQHGRPSGGGGGGAGHRRSAADGGGGAGAA